MDRRRPLCCLALSALPSARAVDPGGGPGNDAAAVAEIRAHWRRLLATDADVASDTSRLQLPDAEWRKRLPPDSHAVLFAEDTEPPLSSPLNQESRSGIFVCRACRLPLFTSEMKYESGTGWPSFFTTIPDHLATKTDYRMILPRTEYHCVRCGGHQDHVFDDGPPPTGERWCNSGLALSFIPLQMTKQGHWRQRGSAA